MTILLMNWNGQEAGRSAAFQCCWPVFVSDILPLLLWSGARKFFFFFFTALDIHPSPEFFLISLHYSGGHLPSVCLCAESLLQWTADGRVQHFSAHQSWYLFNQQLCALGCLYPVKLGLCLHISIRGGLHCNSAWSFHSTCSYAYFFICVRPDHHIATELHQFMLGEGLCRCCALQSAAKISLW